MERYTLRDFLKDFLDEEACLTWLEHNRWPEGITCKVCGHVTRHPSVASRKSFSCQECGHHVHPTAGTIFHKSSTPLTAWFYTIYLMAQTRGGISAKQVEREVGVTYKAAWRMCRLIRERRAQEQNPPFPGQYGVVEADETYIGARRRGGKRGRGAPNKTIAFGIVQRQGKLLVRVVPDVRRRTLIPILERHVEKGATIHTDELSTYNSLGKRGYAHRRILHNAHVYVDGDVHMNTIEGFWATAKTGIIGVYHGVSAKHLQGYLDEYASRYNHREDAHAMVQQFLGALI